MGLRYNIYIILNAIKQYSENPISISSVSEWLHNVSKFGLLKQESQNQHQANQINDIFAKYFFHHNLKNLSKNKTPTIEAMNLLINST